jgi:hypothetical protein|tara:strand:- start:178 stop:495 length:318 start_codon:yes stop_codon:yes gene_type:complete
MQDMTFLMEIQKLAIEMDRVVDKYEMRDRFVSILVSGFMEEDEYGDMRMNAIYSYHLSTFLELTEILDFVNTTFEQDFEDEEYNSLEDFHNDVDDLLDDMGIDTE